MVDFNRILLCLGILGYNTDAFINRLRIEALWDTLGVANTVWVDLSCRYTVTCMFHPTELLYTMVLSSYSETSGKEIQNVSNGSVLEEFLVAMFIMRLLQPVSSI